MVIDWVKDRGIDWIIICVIDWVTCINRYKLGMKTVRHPARERHAVMKTPGNPEHSTQNPDTAILGE